MYKSNSHNNAIVAGLNELRQHADLCDVTLIAEEKSFYAHKTVLVASSTYMRQLFHGDDGFKNEAEVIIIFHNKYVLSFYVNLIFSSTQNSIFLKRPDRSHFTFPWW